MKDINQALAVIGVLSVKWEGWRGGQGLDLGAHGSYMKILGLYSEEEVGNDFRDKPTF